MLNNSTIRTTILLLLIGVAMVITLMVVSWRVLNPQSTNPKPEKTNYPTPTPLIHYYPVPTLPSRS